MPSWMTDLWNAIIMPPLSSYIALGFSAVALLISIWSAMQKWSEFHLSMRKQLTDYISKIHDLNIERAKSEAPNKTGDYPKEFGRLVTDQRRFVARQADYIARKIRSRVTPYELMVIAICMDQIDEINLAEDYFRRALFFHSLSDLERVIIARQYARFMFRLGRVDNGRGLFEYAASKTNGDTARHIIYLGDTYERWASTEAEFGDAGRTVDLIDAAEREYQRLSDNPLKERVITRVQELRTKFKPGQQPAVEVPVAMNAVATDSSP
jgi:hypothetical protein